MVPEVAELYNDLDLEKVRIVRPTKMVFLCGGVIRSDNDTRPDSLRDYLCRIVNLEKYIPGNIVLAERANQLYRDTNYGDLISFEEDIARISGIVLVVAESPGSLAELGAFASNDTIRRSLRVIVQEKYEKAESFIRFGPVERVRKDRSEFVGFFPWNTKQTKGSVKVILRSVRPHKAEILKFIQDNLRKIPATERWPEDSGVTIFYIMLWIIYLSTAITQKNLFDIVNTIVSSVPQKDLRNKLFCLQISGWVDSRSYGGKEYFFVTKDQDPIDYSFKLGVVDNDSSRRKLRVTTALRAFESLPKYIQKLAIERRET